MWCLFEMGEHDSFGKRRGVLKEGISRFWYVSNGGGKTGTMGRICRKRGGYGNGEIERGRGCGYKSLFLMYGNVSGCVVL